MRSDFANLAVADRGVGRGGMSRWRRPRCGGHGRAGGAARGVKSASPDRMMNSSKYVSWLRIVADIHHHADVGGILELRGQRRAVDHLEAGAQEVMPHERERVHVGGIVVSVAARHGIAVAAVHHDASLAVGSKDDWWRDESAGLDLLAATRALSLANRFAASSFLRFSDR